jgi:hypothetical protein
MRRMSCVGYIRGCVETLHIIVAFRRLPSWQGSFVTKYYRFPELTYALKRAQPRDG